MDPTFRFVHAGDLHLERPLGGMADIPDQLRSAMCDAPYHAAERVFDTAVKHRVDFLLLSGDVVQLKKSGPRAIVFLNQQFRKLHDVGISVYWAGSAADNFDSWADAWPLPDNVHRFPTDHVESILHQRDGEPLVRILGTSAAAHGDRRRVLPVDHFRAENDLFTIAVGHGTAEPDQIVRRSIPYWALGGEHNRRALLNGAISAQYCGSPQGRTPDETGPHGCSLIHVDETRRVRTTFVPTDAVRYLQQRLSVEPTTTTDQLLALINERIAEMMTDPFGPDLILEWTVVGSTSLARQLRAGSAGELVSRLRSEHGVKHPLAWTMSIEPPATLVPAELFEEETLLGEFLRSTQRHMQNAEEAMRLDEYLGERHRRGDLAALAALSPGDVRNRVLAEAAALGVELLSPTEERS